MEQTRIRCAIMRGGTSKAVFIMKKDLPADPTMRDKVVRAVFGSPDIRQINGLGGADPLTSKLAVIGPSSKIGCDCDYIFAQVDINSEKIIWDEICGNIVSAVGPFAIDEGLVDAAEPVTRVKINCPNLNTPRTLIAEIPVANGKSRVDGDYQIDGVPGTGAKIGIDWADMAGGTTGYVLPTGNAKDIVEVPELGKVEVSIIDCPNLMVYCRAKDFGLKGTEGPREIDSDQKLLKNLLNAQKAAGKLINAEADGIVAIAESEDFEEYTTGKKINKEEMDFSARQIFMGKLHKTLGGSVTASCGVTARIPGTIVNEIVGTKVAQRSEIRIGHPAGIITCESEIQIQKSHIEVTRAVIFRTARRIMDGYVYVPTKVLEPTA
jgi:2-methylaconitate cis-trans-isomerase PrpF